MTIRPRKSLLNPELTRPSALDSLPRNPAMIWLDKNENLDSEMIELANSIQKEIPSSTLATYPESGECYRKLGEWCGVDPECLLLTPGSDGAIRLTFEVFVEPGDPVLYTNPTFAMYSVYCQMFDAKGVPIEYVRKNEEPYLDPEKLINAILEYSPKLLCLPNPDSPTGTVLEQDELLEILKICKKTGTVFLVDEAYHPFYEKTVISWTDEFPNLVVARTFAKAWALAGLRIGYAVAHKETIALLHKMRPMYEVSSIAVEVVSRMLEHNNVMQKSVSRVNKNKEEFGLVMKQLGYRVLKTEGNFIHVDFGEDADRIHDYLSNKVYYRKSFNQLCLEGYTRFSIGSEDIMQELVSLITKAVKGGIYE